MRLIKFQRNKKIILSGIALAALILIFGNFGFDNSVKTAMAQEVLGPPESLATPAVAGNVQNITAEGTVKESSILLYAVTTLAGWVLSLVAGLIEFALGINSEILKLKIINTGFQNVLTFANLGFVLAIIVIAFATIFRIQSYAMKQTLWKLIVAALLVNFSLVIAGAFINVADILTNFFLTDIKAGGGFSDGLAGLLKPQSAVLVSKEPSVFEQLVKGLVSGGIAGALESWLKYFVSLFFSVVMTLIVILTFIAIAVMFVIRAVYLAILLIIMPVVWLCWIFPKTRSYWDEWWGHFVRWTFFAPIMLFFIKITIDTGKDLNNLSASVISTTGGRFDKMFSSELITPPGFLAHVAQLVIASGLLMGGLFAANKLGIEGSKQAYGAATAMNKNIGHWARRKGVRTAGWGFAGPSNKMLDWATNPKSGRVKQFIGRNLYSIDTAVRGRIQAGVQRAGIAGRPFQKLGQMYRGPKEHQSLRQSIWGGVKSGSGLFKKPAKKKFKLPSGETIQMEEAEEEKKEEKK